MKQHATTYADAHNHINGILPVEAIKVMLSEARKKWDMKPFNIIPSELIPNAKVLSLSNTSITNDYGWIDQLCLSKKNKLVPPSKLFISVKRTKFFFN